MQDPKVIVALDFNELEHATRFIDMVDPSLCKLKVGKEMFTHFGPAWVSHLVNKGFDVFLDLKFHDIPNTVAKACAAAADLGVWMVNVHASGGPVMMEKAKQELEPYGIKAPKLIAVTVLTSMDRAQLSAIGINTSPLEHVQLLANLTQQCGLDGVVCSAQEAAILKQKMGPEFLLVTPGIRPVGAELGDQTRVMTPPDAMAAGVDYMVIGRPITQSNDPVATLKAINASF